MQMKDLRRASFVWVAVMFACLFLPPMFPRIGEALQARLMGIGLLLLGILFLLGMPFVWRKRTDLQGRGLLISFKSSPILYILILAINFAFGAIFALMGTCVILGAHLLPGL